MNLQQAVRICMIGLGQGFPIYPGQGEPHWNFGYKVEAESLRWKKLMITGSACGPQGQLKLYIRRYLFDPRCRASSYRTRCRPAF
jgi:hypothetical protein